MTRFISVIHQYIVEFVKLYKTPASIDVKSVITLVKKLSIFRQVMVIKGRKTLKTGQFVARSPTEIGPT